MRGETAFPVRAFALLLMLALGCSSEGPPVAEVTGRVTWLGLPANAEIEFAPMQTDDEFGGRPSTATTDVEGRFRLQFTPDHHGALLGQHRVRIKVYPSRTEGPERSFAQATTPLRIVELERFVDANDNTFHFPLSP